VRQVSQDFFSQFRRAWYSSSRWLPQGWLDALRQLVLFASAYYAYRIVRGAVDGQATVAFENARTLVDWERGLHLFFEPGLQAWAQGQQWIVTAANFMYVNSHFVITTSFLIWLYIFKNASFYYVRNMFMVAMGLALVLYVIFPAAPPRYLPEWGFTDTVASFVGEQKEQSVNALYNPFAAVPSMHVAFALMIGIPAAKIVKHRIFKVLWCIYPAIVTFVVMVTANHFWLDAFLGALVAAVAASTASYLLGRARPEAWAWRTDSAPVVATPASAPASAPAVA
jgi:hypothetical protein